MLHIVQHPKTKKFEVVSIARNGEFLSGTRQGFEKRAMAIKHIRSQMKNYISNHTFFQDDTDVRAVIFFIPAIGKAEKTGHKPKPKYILNKK